MPLSPEQETLFKKQRQDATLVAFSKFIGFLSAVAIITSIGFVVYRKIQNRPQLEWDYVHQVYGSDGQGLNIERSSGESGKRERSRVTAVDLTTPNSPLATGEQKRGGMQDVPSKQTAIAEMLKEFFTATTLTEMLPLVRDSRRVRVLMEQYYATHPLKAPKWKGLGWAMPVEEPGYQFAYVQVLFEDAEPTHVVVEETEIGFLIDWECYVHYSDLNWEDFLTAKPTEPIAFRVLASKPELGDSAPTGDAQRLVLKIKHPPKEGVLYGFFNPGDVRLRPLVEQLDLCNWKDTPVILKLNYAPGLPDNQVDISGVEGKGWLILSHSRS
ncbi:MAG: hypothetical protein ACOYMN_16595 [Roseimicrobium sp.]